MLNQILVRYTFSTKWILPGVVDNHVLQPSDLFAPRQITIDEEGSSFEVLDVMVGKSSQIFAPFPAKIYGSFDGPPPSIQAGGFEVSEETKKTKIAPKLHDFLLEIVQRHLFVFFKIKNIGGTPGRLLFQLGGIEVKV